MYGKLFASMFRGSLYGKWQAIITIQQMIILADQDGTVDFTPEALAATTSIPLEILKEGISLLESPDPDSRTPDEQGRRIVRLHKDRSWGWLIVNYKKYRQIRTAEERREYHRQHWHKRKLAQPDSTETQQTQPIVEAEANAEAITTLSRKRSLPKDFVIDHDMTVFAIQQGLTTAEVILEGQQFIDHHRAKGSTMKDWKAAWRTWVRNAKKWRRSNGKKTVADYRRDLQAKIELTSQTPKALKHGMD